MGQKAQKLQKYRIAKILQDCPILQSCTILEITGPQLSKTALHFELSRTSAELWAVKGRALWAYLIAVLHKSFFEMRHYNFGPNELKFGQNTVLP